MTATDDRPAEMAVRSFEERFSSRPAMIGRAPGRVNLIGEHTDYNDGFVMPMALPFETVVAASPIEDGDPGEVELTSMGYGTVRFNVNDDPADTPRWARYVHGMAVLLSESGVRIPSWRGVIASDIPIGASLSSSAALEIATGITMVRLASEWVPMLDLALLGQRVENEIIGINSGIMDQLASAVSVGGHASLIDCRSLSIRPSKLPASAVVVVMDTGTRRELVDSEYDDRRAACERVADELGLVALRDATIEQVLTIPDNADRHRAQHVVSENNRTLRAAAAMADGNAGLLGELMNQSHASLRDDFEVSSPALNAIVAIAQDTEGCFGARMTGGGFAGCAVALVSPEYLSGFTHDVLGRYQRLHLTDPGLKPQLWDCEPSPGASLKEF